MTSESADTSAKGARVKSRLAIKIACGSVALLMMGTSSPAEAASRVKTDTNPDPDYVTPAYDLRRVKWDYGSDRFVVTAKLGKVKKKVILRASAHHGAKGYEVEAVTRWKDGRKVNRLWIWYNTVSPTRIRCSGLSSKWRLGNSGSIRLSIPNDCLFSGYPMDRFTVMTLKPGAFEGTDTIATRRSLDSD